MKFVTTMLCDCDNLPSSKRVVTFLAFLLCSAAFVADLGWGLKIDPVVYQSMMYIVIAGLGFTASEQFAAKN